jgi:hypothetical protein
LKIFTVSTSLIAVLEYLDASLRSFFCVSIAGWSFLVRTASNMTMRGTKAKMTKVKSQE